MYVLYSILETRLCTLYFIRYITGLDKNYYCSTGHCVPVEALTKIQYRAHKIKLFFSTVGSQEEATRTKKNVLCEERKNRETHERQARML